MPAAALQTKIKRAIKKVPRKDAGIVQISTSSQTKNNYNASQNDADFHEFPERNQSKTALAGRVQGEFFSRKKSP